METTADLTGTIVQKIADNIIKMSINNQTANANNSNAWESARDLINGLADTGQTGMFLDKKGNPLRTNELLCLLEVQRDSTIYSIGPVILTDVAYFRNRHGVATYKLTENTFSHTETTGMKFSDAVAKTTIKIHHFAKVPGLCTLSRIETIEVTVHADKFFQTRWTKTEGVSMTDIGAPPETTPHMHALAHTDNISLTFYNLDIISEPVPENIKDTEKLLNRSNEGCYKLFWNHLASALTNQGLNVSDTCNVCKTSIEKGDVVMCLVHLQDVQPYHFGHYYCFAEHVTMNQTCPQCGIKVGCVESKFHEDDQCSIM